MDKKLAEEKGAIEAEYMLKREELLREYSTQNINLGAMEKVLEDVKTLNDKISVQKHERATLEEELNETQFARSKIEQKVKTIKNKRMTDEVTLEHDLKSELESKKL